MIKAGDAVWVWLPFGIEASPGVVVTATRQLAGEVKYRVRLGSGHVGWYSEQRVKPLKTRALEDS